MSDLNILYPFDNNYAEYAGISLTSLLENNKDSEKIVIYILGFDLTDETKSLLKKTIEKYRRDIVFINQDSVDKLIHELNLPSYRGARVATARLFVTHFLPKNLERIVYLDSDTIIVGSMKELIEEDLDGCPVGMVCDSVARDYKRVLGFSAEEDYYNAGVILYDLSMWREKKCTERIIEHIQNIRSNYEALDQDLINLTLKDEIKRINLKYNFQPVHMVYSSQKYKMVYGTEGYYSIQEIEEASSNQIILHAFRYLGMFPWHVDSVHPAREKFMEYKNISLWKSTPALSDYKKGFVISIERVLYRILPATVFLRIFKWVFEFTIRKNNKRLLVNKKYGNV